MQNKLTQLCQKLGETLIAQQLKLATAESCTGGWVAEAITAIPGSSQWFERGFVTYSNQAKHEMLGVHQATLDEFGAVSEQVAREMAEGVLRHSHAHLSLATTGVAGPDGGSEQKPVGMVCFAWAGQMLTTKTVTEYFQGDRQSIREQAVEFVLAGAVSLIFS